MSFSPSLYNLQKLAVEEDSRWSKMVVAYYPFEESFGDPLDLGTYIQRVLNFCLFPKSLKAGAIVTARR